MSVEMKTYTVDYLEDMLLDFPSGREITVLMVHCSTCMLITKSSVQFTYIFLPAREKTVFRSSIAC